MTELNTTVHAPVKSVCQLDAQNLYIGTTLADLDPVAADGSYLLPAGCVDTAPPETRDGHAAQWQHDNQTWVYLPDLRGQTAYRTDNGTAETLTEIGALPDHLTLLPPPSEHHTWDGETWTLDPNTAERIAAEQFQAARVAKLAELNRAAQTFVNHAAGLDSVPDFEIRTWAIQELEAKAWHTNPEADTPMLDSIAAARGVPPEILKQKAYEKAMKFEQLTAYTAGLRQGIADKIAAAQTQDDLDKIVVDFKLPESAAS